MSTCLQLLERRRGLFGAAVLLLAAASRASGQSYGDHEQVLTLGAPSFAGVEGQAALDADGYAHGLFTKGRTFERAALILPEGAEVLQLCFYGDDRDDHDNQSTVVSLRAAKMMLAGGGDPFVLIVPGGSVTSTVGAGFASYCTEPLSYTMRSSLDLDGDGNSDSVAYYVDVGLGWGGRFGGVTVTWKRQVSPVPDTPTFDDVPASDPAFPYIEALAASGITVGCGGPNYCPGAPLTRRQMAVYLAKALGLYWPN